MPKTEGSSVVMGMTDSFRRLTSAAPLSSHVTAKARQGTSI
jgi:hypothetical protein